MADYMVRATAANAQIRAFACTTRGVVEDARRAHNTSPVVTAALGRLLSAGAMMGGMMKGDKDILTLRIKGDGPLRGLTVTADSRGNVKGYPDVTDVILPANPMGKLDVGGAVGRGILSVVKDLGLKEPYVGQISLVSGEIAEDLTQYFASSEQVLSAVGLGVLMERNNTVKQAGGYIIQLMPFAEDAIVDTLEMNLKGLSSVTTLLDAGNTPEQMLEFLLSGLDLQITGTTPVKFFCDCNRKKIESLLIGLGGEELLKMVEEGKEIEINCNFCNTNHKFGVDELQELYNRSK